MKTDEDILVIDRLDDLELVASSPSSEKKTRGFIRTKDDHLPIATALPFADEYVLSQDDDITNVTAFPFLTQPLSRYTAFSSKEGALVRVFFHNGQWYIVTHRKLDAFQSYWSSTLSFGDLFLNGLSISTGVEITRETYQSLLNDALDRDSLFFFFIHATQESRIVCRVTETHPRIVYVGRRPRCDLEALLDQSPLQGQWASIECMVPQAFDSWVDVFDAVKHIDCWTSQGVLLFDRETSRQIKLIPSTYNALWSVRGNQPNVMFRYLQIRTQPDVVSTFMTLYPEWAVRCSHAEQHIHALSAWMYTYYVSRYIYKHTFILPKQEHIFLKKVHGVYLESRERVTYSTVRRILDREPVPHLYVMLKRVEAIITKGGCPPLQPPRGGAPPSVPQEGGVVFTEPSSSIAPRATDDSATAHSGLLMSAYTQECETSNGIPQATTSPTLTTGDHTTQTV